MAYASITHVIAHHAGRPSYTASTRITTTHVAQFLDEASAELDFHLVKGGYDVTLLSSAPSAVKAFFQKANADGALCMIERSAPQGHNESDFCQAFRSACKLIETGQLPGLEKNADESLPRYNAGAASMYFFRDMEL
jgi:alpha-beta hydrolase superfamily lysophospholipase